MTTPLPNVVNVSKMSLLPFSPSQTFPLSKNIKLKNVSVSPAIQRDFVISALLPLLRSEKAPHFCRQEDVLSSNPTFSVAYDLPSWTDKKTGKLVEGTKTYEGFNSVFDFVPKFRAQRCSYEILVNGSAVSPFLDLEKDCASAEEVESLLAQIPPLVEAALEKILRQPVQVQWWTSSSAETKKFSLHALVREMRCHMRGAKAIAHLVTAELGEFGGLVKANKYEKKEVQTDVVDKKIYTRNRVFRLPLCTKYGKTRVKLPAPFNKVDLFGETGLKVLAGVLAGDKLTEGKTEVLLGQLLYQSTVAFSSRNWEHIQFEEELIAAAGMKKEASSIKSEDCTEEEHQQGLAMWKAFETAVPAFASCLEVDEIGRCSKDGGSSWLQVKLRRVGGCRGCVCARPLNGGHDSQGGFLSIWAGWLSFTCWGSHAKGCNHFTVSPWNGETMKETVVEEWKEEPANERGFFCPLPEGFEYVSDEEDDEEINIYDEDESEEVLVVEAVNVDEAKINSLIDFGDEVEAIEKKKSPTSSPSVINDVEDWLAVYLVPDESSYVKIPDLVTRVNSYFDDVSPEVRGYKPSGSRLRTIPSLTEVIEKKGKVSKKRIDSKQVNVLLGFSLLEQSGDEVEAIEKKKSPTSSPPEQKKKVFVFPTVPDHEVFREEPKVVKRDFKDWADLASVGKAICLSSPMGAGKTRLLLEGCKGKNVVFFAFRCELALEYYTECTKAGLNTILYSHSKGRILMPMDKPAVLVITPDSIPRLDPSNGWRANLIVMDETTFLLNQMGGFIPKKILARLENSKNFETFENPTELIWDMIRKVETVVFADAMITNAHLNVIRQYRRDIVPVVMERTGIKAEATYVEGVNKFRRLLKEKLAEEVMAGRSLSFSSNTKKILVELFEEYKEKKLPVETAGDPEAESANSEQEPKEEKIRVCLITSDGFQTNDEFKPHTYKEAAGWAQLLLTSPKISAGNSYINSEGESVYKVHFGLASPQSTPGEDFVQSLARNRSIEKVYVSVTNRPGCGQVLPSWVQNVDQVKKWALSAKDELTRFGIKFSRFDGEILNSEQATMTFLYMWRRHASQTKEKYLRVIIPLMKRNGMEIKEVVTEEEEEKVNLKEQREIRIRHEVEKLTETNLALSCPAIMSALKIARIAGQIKAGKVSPFSEDELGNGKCKEESRLSKSLAEKAVREQWLKKKKVLDEILTEPVNEPLSADKLQLVRHFEVLAKIENLQSDSEISQVLEEATQNGWLKKPEEIKVILTRVKDAKQNKYDRRHLLKQLKTLEMVQNAEHIKNIHSARQCLPNDFDINRAIGVVLNLDNFAAARGDLKKAALFFKSAGLKVEPETGKVVGNIWQITNEPQLVEQPSG